MTATMETALIDGVAHVASIAEEYKTRLAAVRERITSYHPDCQYRYASDEYHQAAHRMRGAAEFLAGDYDRTYCSGLGYATVEDWRVHYAADALRTALHHIVWAEHYAGLTDRETASSADPWNNR
jgi:hypothetical protein